MKIFNWIFVFIFYSVSNGQSVTVKDSLTGLPLDNVNIFNTSGSRASVSSAGGFADISMFSSLDTLIFSHVAYEKKQHPAAELFNNPVVLLQPVNIKSGEVIIIDKKVEGGNSFSEKVNVTGEMIEKYTNAGDLIKGQTSLFVRDYGGMGGAKTVSARGLSSENTVVLFNDARINDMRTGMADLSVISSSGVSGINYLKNAADEDHYPAAGGILKIYSGSSFEGSKIKAGIKLSTDDYRSAAISYTGGSSELYFNVTGERAFSSNHYPYRFNGNELKRENSDFNKTFIGAALNYDSDMIKASLYSNYVYMKSGIPGFVVTNNYSSSRAQNLNKSFLTVMNLNTKWLDNLNTRTIVSFSMQSLIIHDPEGILVYSGSQKDSKLNDLSVQNKIEYSSGQFTAGLHHSFNYSGLNNITSFVSANESPSSLRSYNNTLFLGSSYLLFKPMGLPAGVKLYGGTGIQFTEEKLLYRNNFSDLYFRGGAAFYPEGIPALVFKIHYANEFRTPTFNERYYSTLFNHYDLKKERYSSFDAGVEARADLLGGFEISAIYFEITGTDKIIWIPTRLAIQTPRNIARVLSRGAEISFTQKLFDKKIEIGGIYNYTYSINKTRLSENDKTFNKQLIYTPLHKLNASLLYRIDDYYLSVQSTFVSSRFYTSDNNPLYQLPAYFITDLSGGVNFNLFGAVQRFALTVFNIFNEEYFVIQSYPMPLRTFLFSYSMEI